MLPYIPDRFICPPWLCASCSYSSLRRGMGARSIWMPLHCRCVTVVRSLPTIRFFFSFCSSLNQCLCCMESPLFLREARWCPSSDNFRKMYWAVFSYLLIINVESYHQVISSGTWVRVTWLCPYLPNTDFFPGDNLSSYQGWSGGVLAKVHS